MTRADEGTGARPPRRPAADDPPPHPEFSLELAALLELLGPVYGTRNTVLPVHTTGRGAMEAVILQSPLTRRRDRGLLQWEIWDIRMADVERTLSALGDVCRA